MKALQLMDVQENVIFIAACCRQAQELRKPRRRAAGGRRGRSISMSAHRLKPTASKWRPASTVLRGLCYAALVRKSLNDIAFTLFLTFMRTKRAERGKSATAAVAPDWKHKKWNRRRQRYSYSLPSRTKLKKALTNTIGLAATRSA